MVRAILAREFAVLEPDVVLALRYAEAVLSHAPELDPLHAEIQRRWGNRGLVSLAFGITSSRMFPLLKYALGFAHTCAVLEVNRERAPFKRANGTLIQAIALEPGESGQIQAIYVQRKPEKLRHLGCCADKSAASPIEEIM